MAKRLFFAVPLTELAEDNLAEQADRLAQWMPDRQLRWIAPANYHLTLHFLGELSEAHLQDLAEITADVAQRYRQRHSNHAYLIESRQLDWFPSPNKARMLTALVGKNDALMQLQQSLGTALQRRGFTVEKRRFRPHVSVARIGRGNDRGMGVGSLHPGPVELLPTLAWPLDELVLFESLLRPEGAAYTPVVVEPLATIADA